MGNNVEIYQLILETFNREGDRRRDAVLHRRRRGLRPRPARGPYRGPEAARRVAELLMSGFEDVEVKDFRLLSAGDRVVALLHTRAKGERVDLEVETARRAHHHLPRRQDRLLAALPRPGRGAHRRRPRSRARERQGPLRLGFTGVGSASSRCERRGWPRLMVVLAAGLAAAALASAGERDRIATRPARGLAPDAVSLPRGPSGGRRSFAAAAWRRLLRRHRPLDRADGAMTSDQHVQLRQRQQGAAACRRAAAARSRATAARRRDPGAARSR